MTVTLPLAHLLHWYFMPLYALPMVIVLYSTIRETIRQRREHEDEQPSEETGRDDPSR
jgi:hypothetical protein